MDKTPKWNATDASQQAYTQYKLAREQLVAALRAVAKTADRHAIQLGMNPNLRPNPLGILQGEARDVERLCAVVEERRAAWEQMAVLAGAEASK